MSNADEVSAIEEVDTRGWSGLGSHNMRARDIPGLDIVSEMSKTPRGE